MKKYIICGMVIWFIYHSYFHNQISHSQHLIKELSIDNTNIQTVLNIFSQHSNNVKVSTLIPMSKISDDMKIENWIGDQVKLKHQGILFYLPCQISEISLIKHKDQKYIKWEKNFNWTMMNKIIPKEHILMKVAGTERSIKYCTVLRAQWLYNNSYKDDICVTQHSSIESQITGVTFGFLKMWMNLYLANDMCHIQVNNDYCSITLDKTLKEDFLKWANNPHTHLLHLDKQQKLNQIGIYISEAIRFGPNTVLEAHITNKTSVIMPWLIQWYRIKQKQTENN